LSETGSLSPSFWRERLAPYAQPRLSRSIFDVATSAVPYVIVTGAMYALYGQVSYWIVLALGVLAAGFLLRTFIVFHDCGHGSFLPNRRANKWVGITCAILTYQAYHPWRYEHAVHHATAGDLDKRGVGDVETMTASEYRKMSWLGRLGYRLMRNPAVMLIIGPLWSLLFEPRLMPAWARRRFGLQIMATNLVLVLMLGGLVVAFGWQTVLLVMLPTAMIAGGAGVFMFYVQHQFEGVYWQRHEDWSYADSALKGSSYLKLPKLLQFFTGNIGLHHVHHLHPRIPNYNLQRAHDDNPVFHDVPTLGVWSGLKTFRLKLYDEDLGRMVTFAGARRSYALHSRRGAPLATAETADAVIGGG
jgi:acyl-lipid omega-6 desaturase (Delta-12 desaturase)